MAVDELRAKIRYGIATSIHAAIQQGFMGYDEAADKVLKIALEYSNNKLNEAAENLIDDFSALSYYEREHKKILSLKDKM